EMHVQEYPSGRELLTIPVVEGLGLASWAFSPGGQRLAAVRGGRTLLGWDLTSGREGFKLDGPLRNPGPLCLSDDGRRLVAVDGGKVLRVWDVATGKELLCLENLPPGGQPVLSPDGQLIARSLVGTRPQEAGVVLVWDAVTGTQRLTLKGHPHPV